MAEFFRMWWIGTVLVLAAAGAGAAVIAMITLGSAGYVKTAVILTAPLMGLVCAVCGKLMDLVD